MATGTTATNPPPLPNGAGGFQLGAGNRREVSLGYMFEPQQLPLTGTAVTLTPQQLAGKVLVVPNTSTVATITLPPVNTTAAGVQGLEEYVSSATLDSFFDLSIVNGGTAAVTLALVPGYTNGGLAINPVNPGESGTFRFRKSNPRGAQGGGQWTIYKVAGTYTAAP